MPSATDAPSMLLIKTVVNDFMGFSFRINNGMIYFVKIKVISDNI